MNISCSPSVIVICHPNVCLIAFAGHFTSARIDVLVLYINQQPSVDVLMLKILLIKIASMDDTKYIEFVDFILVSNTNENSLQIQY